MAVSINRAQQAVSRVRGQQADLSVGPVDAEALVGGDIDVDPLHAVDLLDLLVRVPADVHHLLPGLLADAWQIPNLQKERQVVRLAFVWCRRLVLQGVSYVSQASAGASALLRGDLHFNSTQCVM